MAQAPTSLAPPPQRGDEFDRERRAWQDCAGHVRYRKLDPLEAGFELLDRYHDSGANLVGIAELSIGVAQQRWREATRQLQRESPWLSVCIAQDGADFWFDADSSAIAVATSDDDCDRVVDRELATPLPRHSGPLCRITVIKNSTRAFDTLVVCVHHSICDANALQHLIYRLLYLCTCGNIAAAALDRCDFPTQTFSQQSRPQWPLRKRGYAWYRLLRYALFVAKGQLIRLESTQAMPTKRRTVRHCWAFDESETKAIVAATRTNGASVTGALCAAAAMVARNYQADGAADTTMRLRVNCNVSLWPLIPDQARWPTLGSFVTMIQLGARVPPTLSLWPIARTCTGAARDRPRETIRDVSMLVANRMRYRASELLEKLSQDERKCGRVAAVHVSNVGIVDNQRPAVLQSFRFAVPQHVAGAMLWVSAATVQNRLHGTLLTVAPLLSPQTSEAMATALRQTLLAACT